MYLVHHPEKPLVARLPNGDVDVCVLEAKVTTEEACEGISWTLGHQRHRDPVEGEGTNFVAAYAKLYHRAQRTGCHRLVTCIGLACVMLLEREWKYIENREKLPGRLLFDLVKSIHPPEAQDRINRQARKIVREIWYDRQLNKKPIPANQRYTSDLLELAAAYEDQSFLLQDWISLLQINPYAFTAFAAITKHSLDLGINYLAIYWEMMRHDTPIVQRLMMESFIKDCLNRDEPQMRNALKQRDHHFGRITGLRETIDQALIFHDQYPVFTR